MPATVGVVGSTGWGWRRLVAASAVVAIGFTLGCASTASARRATVGWVQHGKASYYASKFAGRKTASGERYDPNLMTAAHKSLPLGTRIRVTRTTATRWSSRSTIAAAARAAASSISPRSRPES